MPSAALSCSADRRWIRRGRPSGRRRDGHRPLGAAASCASRVLPTPPGPVSVTSRWAASSSRTAGTASVRPTSAVSSEPPGSRAAGSRETGAGASPASWERIAWWSATSSGPGSTAQLVGQLPPQRGVAPPAPRPAVRTGTARGAGRRVAAPAAGGDEPAPPARRPAGWCSPSSRRASASDPRGRSAAARRAARPRDAGTPRRPGRRRPPRFHSARASVSRSATVTRVPGVVGGSRQVGEAAGVDGRRGRPAAGIPAPATPPASRPPARPCANARRRRETFVCRAPAGLPGSRSPHSVVHQPVGRDRTTRLDEQGGQQCPDLRLGDLDRLAGSRRDGERAEHREVHARTVTSAATNRHRQRIRQNADSTVHTVGQPDEPARDTAEGTGVTDMSENEKTSSPRCR